MLQISTLSRPAGAICLCLCVGAALAGCAQSGRSTLGGPADPASSEEQQRTRGSMHPMPPAQNMPGGGEATGGEAAGGGAAGNGARSSPGQ